MKHIRDNLANLASPERHDELGVTAFAVVLVAMPLLLASALLFFASGFWPNEGSRMWSSEPRVVETVGARSYEELIGVAGFNVITPAYLPEGLSSEGSYSYVPELSEAELTYYPVRNSASSTQLIVRITEALDPERLSCPPCGQSVLDLDERTISGQQVFLAGPPLVASEALMAAYFWVSDVRVTIVMDHGEDGSGLPSKEWLEAEILRIAESMMMAA